MPLLSILSQSGGIASLTPADAVRVLWAFATLGGPPPCKLLSTIQPHWQWWVRSRDQAAAAGAAGDVEDTAVGATRTGSTPGSNESALANGDGMSGDGMSAAHVGVHGADVSSWDPLESDPQPRLQLLSDVDASGRARRVRPAFSAASPSSSSSSRGGNSGSSSNSSSSSTSTHTPSTSSAPATTSISIPLPHHQHAKKGRAGGRASASAMPPVKGLDSFTTSQLAGCCWALSVIPGGLDTPAFLSAWRHLMRRFGVAAQGQNAQPRDLHSLPAASTATSTSAAASCSDAVLSQIWQVQATLHWLWVLAFPLRGVLDLAEAGCRRAVLC